MTLFQTLLRGVRNWGYPQNEEKEGSWKIYGTATDDVVWWKDEVKEHWTERFANIKEIDEYNDNETIETSNGKKI